MNWDEKQGTKGMNLQLQTVQPKKKKKRKEKRYACKAVIEGSGEN